MAQTDQEGPQSRIYKRPHEIPDDVEQGALNITDPKSNHDKEALHLLRIYKEKPELLITLLG